LLRLVKAGDGDGATALFQIEVIGLPPEMVEGMRQSEVWGFLTGLAHSLPYDYALFEAGGLADLPAEVPRLSRQRFGYLPQTR
jgi:hypothetical protein